MSTSPMINYPDNDPGLQQFQSALNIITELLLRKVALPSWQGMYKSQLKALGGADGVGGGLGMIDHAVIITDIYAALLDPQMKLREPLNRPTQLNEHNNFLNDRPRGSVKEIIYNKKITIYPRYKGPAPRKTSDKQRSDSAPPAPKTGTRPLGANNGTTSSGSSKEMAEVAQAKTDNSARAVLMSQMEALIRNKSSESLDDIVLTLLPELAINISEGAKGIKYKGEEIPINGYVENKLRNNQRITQDSDAFAKIYMAISFSKQLARQECLPTWNFMYELQLICKNQCIEDAVYATDFYLSLLKLVDDKTRQPILSNDKILSKIRPPIGKPDDIVAEKQLQQTRKTFLLQFTEDHKGMFARVKSDYRVATLVLLIMQENAEINALYLALHSYIREHRPQSPLHKSMDAPEKQTSVVLTRQASTEDVGAYKQRFLQRCGSKKKPR